jgi:hypothetical protein
MIGLSTPYGIERVLPASTTAIGPDLGKDVLGQRVVELFFSVWLVRLKLVSLGWLDELRRG